MYNFPLLIANGDMFEPPIFLKDSALPEVAELEIKNPLYVIE